MAVVRHKWFNTRKTLRMVPRTSKYSILTFIIIPIFPEWLCLMFFKCLMNVDEDVQGPVEISLYLKFGIIILQY